MQAARKMKYLNPACLHACLAEAGTGSGICNASRIHQLRSRLTLYASGVQPRQDQTAKGLQMERRLFGLMVAATLVG